MEVTEHFVTDSYRKAEIELLGKAAKGTGFGVLWDRIGDEGQAMVEFFPTRQVHSEAEMRRIFAEYRRRRGRDTRKAIDRTEWDAQGRPHPRIVNTGYFDTAYKLGL